MRFRRIRNEYVPVEPSCAEREFAHALMSMHVALMQAGFTEDQALSIVCARVQPAYVVQVGEPE